MTVKTIAVGSTNPVKVAAVTKAVSANLPSVKVLGVDTDSGVPEQPRSDHTTKTGAYNRALSALHQTSADIGVGIEGGVFKNGNELWNTVWCCAVDKSKRVSFANGERFILPKRLSRAIINGQEMGPAMDQLTKRQNVKHQEGMLGVVSGGWISRQSAYTHLISLTLGRLLTTNWR